MKKLIFALLFFVALGTQAQVVSMTATQDTLINAGTTSHVKLVKDYYNSITIVAVAHKISGTVGGTLALQGSLDNEHWFSADTTTLTLANQVTNKISWTLTGTPYYYFRVVGTGSGTMRAVISAKLLARKP